MLLYSDKIQMTVFSEQKMMTRFPQSSPNATIFNIHQAHRQCVMIIMHV